MTLEEQLAEKEKQITELRMEVTRLKRVEDSFIMYYHDMMNKLVGLLEPMAPHVREEAIKKLIRSNVYPPNPSDAVQMCVALYEDNSKLTLSKKDLSNYLQQFEYFHAFIKGEGRMGKRLRFEISLNFHNSKSNLAYIQCEGEQDFERFVRLCWDACTKHCWFAFKE